MIGRPQQSEVGAYYFRYIDQVAGEDPLAVIESQLEESLALFSGISEERSLYRYAPEKWSIRQVLNHVNDVERAFAFRAHWFGRGFPAPLPSYDHNLAVANAEADKISWAAHLEEFRSVRLATISLLALHRARLGLYHPGARGAPRQNPARPLPVSARLGQHRPEGVTACTINGTVCHESRSEMSAGANYGKSGAVCCMAESLG